jgi:hypothetical protein
MKNGQANNKRRSSFLVRQRENLLLALGMFIVGLEAVNVEILSRPFHAELFLGGLTLCGVGITQKFDKGAS